MEEQLIEWRNSIALLEKTFSKTDEFLMQNEYRFRSEILTECWTHLRAARMFAGDMLRLWQLQEKHREDQVRWLPVELKNNEFADKIWCALELRTMWESEYVELFKKEIRKIFYQIIDKEFDLTNEKFSKKEFQMYWVRTAAELNLADKCLGLRRAEIASFEI